MIFICTAAAAQTSTDWKTIYESGGLQTVAANTDSSADAMLYKGLALARLHQPDAAREVFLQAERVYSNDSRFPVELGGLFFQAKDYRSAIKSLQRAMRLNPSDEYANNFLGSMYLLTGNLDAAVKCWNHISKPVIDRIEFIPEPHLDPVILDRAITTSPRSVLELGELKATEARLEALGVFSSPQYSLQAKADGQFDFILRANQKKGFGSSKPQALLRLLRGLPYWTVYPEYYNIGSMGTNITSLLRWDSNKRRIALNVSSPFRNRPSLRWRLFADARDENWVLSPDTATAFGFHSRQYEVGAELEQVISGTWSWKVATALVHDRAPTLTATDVATTGYSLQYRAQVKRVLLGIPERRLNITANVAPVLGRNFASGGSTFATAQAATELNWMPGAEAGDYEVTARLSAGVSRGTLPFSNLFMLGVERDNDLLLRGDPGTLDGKKGSAPLAHNYLLGNFNFLRRLYNNGLIDIRLGPFVDVARPWKALQTGVPTWLVDPGVSLKVRVLGSATVTFSYGRNLHDGRNAFYASALR